MFSLKDYFYFNEVKLFAIQQQQQLKKLLFTAYSLKIITAYTLKKEVINNF